MHKKILTIYYTQSGQMSEIMDAFTKPLRASGASVEQVIIKPLANYQFPWTGKGFFSVMPACVLGIPGQLEPLNLKESNYDLVIMGYQPWFLSPSIPSNSLLQNEYFKAVLKDTPVITVSEARNMWLNAYSCIQTLLQKAGARHVGNIALVDRHPNFVSFVTIFYWMLTGRKERYLNIFPKPGVSEPDIAGMDKFGHTVADFMERDNWDGLQDELLKQNAAHVNYKLMVIEARAKPIFTVWARFIAKRENQGPWISAFKYYLFIALFLGAPILLTLDAVFLKPFSSKKIKAKTLNYLQVN